MMNTSASAMASLLLTQRLVDIGTKPFTASEYWPLVRAVGDPGDMLGRSAEDLAATFAEQGSDASSERVAALLDTGAALAFELERLQQIGIEVITPFDEAWPSRISAILGAAAPVMLHVAGDAGLLQSPGLGIVGSRDVDEDGAEVARSAARVAAADGFATISGGARGVDQLAMQAAVEAQGPSVGVLADSLEKALRASATRQVLMEGLGCLATPYAPGARFTAGNAMGRNKIIYALSSATLVVASDVDMGGTWAGATEALRRGFGRVLVWRGNGEGPGNGILVEKGAVPVTSCDEVASQLRVTADSTPLDRSDDHAAQLSLGL